MRDLARIFAEIKDALSAGGDLLLLSDYDGTLTPIVSDPAEAWLDPVVRDDLAALAESPRVRIGVISGRALHDLRARVGVPGIIYAGCHGLEARGPGIAFTHPEAETQRQAIAALAEGLACRLASIEGARAESKGLTVAVHYRDVPRGFASLVQSQIEQVLYEHGGAFKILKGKKVTEILPHVHWNKGECSLWIRDRVLPELRWPAATLYLGDDRADEIAFKALAGKSVTVRVGPAGRRSAATHRLENVADVHRLLSALAAEAGERRPL